MWQDVHNDEGTAGDVKRPRLEQYAPPTSLAAGSGHTPMHVATPAFLGGAVASAVVGATGLHGDDEQPFEPIDPLEVDDDEALLAMAMAEEAELEAQAAAREEGNTVQPLPPPSMPPPGLGGPPMQPHVGAPALPLPHQVAAPPLPVPARSGPPVDWNTAQFVAMLRDLGVGALSSWDHECERLKKDRRFMLLPNMKARRAEFEKYQAALAEVHKVRDVI